MLSEQTKNVRSSMENKGWIIQMRVFVFILHHKESKVESCFPKWHQQERKSSHYFWLIRSCTDPT